MGIGEVAKDLGKAAIGALNRAASPERICYWEHGSWYSLRNSRGDFLERREEKRPTGDVLTVRGGRDRALAAARQWWGSEAEGQPAHDEAADQDDQQVKGEKPPEGEPLEDEPDVHISERRERITPSYGGISGHKTPRLTPGLGKRGLGWH